MLERSAAATDSALRTTFQRTAPFDLVYERYSLWSTAGMEHARATGVTGVLEINAPLIDEASRYRGLVDRMGAEQATRRCFGAASVLTVVSAAEGPMVERARDFVMVRADADNETARSHRRQRDLRCRFRIHRRRDVALELTGDPLLERVECRSLSHVRGPRAVER
jgi:hypothetical protein